MGKISDKNDVEIGKLKPYEKNAKMHSDKQVQQIADSIREFGFLNPCLIDKENNIIAGHGRVAAAKLLGMETVPCVYVEGLTEEQRRAYILADNRLTELGEWDMSLVAEELKDLQEFGFDTTLTGFSLEEEQGQAIEDDFDVTPPEKARTRRGQVWALGAHRVMCGDATDPKDVQKIMGGGRADLYLTDPPYNIDYTGKTKKKLKIENDKKGSDDFRAFLVNAFSAAKEQVKAGAAFYIWHADSEGYNFRGACSDVGWQVRECLIWHKDVFTLGRQDYQWQHEPCLYGWSDGASHVWYSDRKQTTVLQFDRPKKSEEHPTMKPVPLFDYLIKNSTKEGDIVLDTFAGSGTTIIACEQNGRRGYCMELDPRYMDVIIDRWENFTGQKAVLIEE